MLDSHLRTLYIIMLHTASKPVVIPVVKLISVFIALLEKVGLKGLPYRRADTLSGGEAQRVAIARVVALDP